MERRSELVPVGSQRDTSEPKIALLKNVQKLNLPGDKGQAISLWVFLRDRCPEGSVSRVCDLPAACWGWCVTESRGLPGRCAGGCRCASWSWGRWCNGCRNLYRVHWPSLTLIGGFATPGWPSPSEGNTGKEETPSQHANTRNHFQNTIIYLIMHGNPFSQMCGPRLWTNQPTNNNTFWN